MNVKRAPTQRYIGMAPGWAAWSAQPRRADFVGLDGKGGYPFLPPCGGRAPYQASLRNGTAGSPAPL